MKTYVGVKHLNSNNEFSRTVFKNTTEPTAKDFPQYVYVIGPFKTMRGAKFMRDFGFNNPHCQHVNDAERLAKLSN